MCSSQLIKMPITLVNLACKKILTQAMCIAAGSAKQFKRGSRRRAICLLSPVKRFPLLKRRKSKSQLLKTRAQVSIWQIVDYKLSSSLLAINLKSARHQSKLPHNSHNSNLLLLSSNWTLELCLPLFIKRCHYKTSSRVNRRSQLSGSQTNKGNNKS